MRDDKDEPVFIYPSQNSSLILQNKKNHVFCDEGESRQETFDFFEMSDPEIKKIWFNTHNKQQGFSGSGFKMGRITTINMYFEPLNIHVDKLLDPK